jgi:hypothetical protein
MALPTLTNRYGVALIRRDVATGEEFLDDWLDNGRETTTVTVAPGAWEWRIAMIIGSNVSAVPQFYRYDQRETQIVLLAGKR